MAVESGSLVIGGIDLLKKCTSAWVFATALSCFCGVVFMAFNLSDFKNLVNE